jgi:hypothetical protein
MSANRGAAHPITKPYSLEEMTDALDELILATK